VKWNWLDLFQAVVPVVVSWLMGALGIGIPKVTPSRIMNKE
jgi:hypothetical protein